MLELSASAVGVLTQCGRKYKYKYVDRMEEIGHQTGPAALGTAFHEGARVIKSGSRDYLGAVRSKLQYCKPVESKLVELMTTAWATRYANDGLRYILNEQEFEVTLDGIKIRGIIDGIARNPEGELVLVEHKTTDNDIKPSAMYWRRLDINHQIDIYIWAAEQIGYPVSHAIYDVVRWPKLFPEKATPLNKREKYKRGSHDGKYGKGDYKPWVRLKDETPAEFNSRCIDHISSNLGDLLVREPVYRSANEIEKTLTDVRDCAKVIGSGGYPRNPWACHMGRKYTCEYHPVCTSQTELTNQNLYQIRARR